MAAQIQKTSISSPYSPDDIELINPSSFESFFNPSLDYIEFVVTSPNNSYQSIDYNYKNFSFPINGTVISTSTNELDINPSSDLNRLGITGGDYDLYYNFLHNELGTSYNNQSIIIKEISADRTEIKARCLNDIDLQQEVNNLKLKVFNGSYISDFYLNFGDNNLLVANNIDVDNTTDIIINLANPIPNSLDFNVNTKFWVVTKIADTLSFSATFTPEPVTPTVTSFPLKGPNLNLSSKDQLNNSTVYLDYNTLITSSLLSTSYSQLNNLISSSGIEINVDYTDFSKFVYFSSAVQRIKNFATKVAQISSSQAEINILTGSVGYITSSNITILTKDINNIIENFDGYEYYLYYDSGSYSWPKSNSTVPYTLYSPTSTEVTDWLGNEDPYDIDYGGILSSASIYDNDNLNYLYKTVPEYLRDDPQNTPYKSFIDLIGQHYDDIWVYYQDITNLYQADNRLDHGISKDLVAQALRSFGVNLYQNNFSVNDLYSAFLGYGAINPETTGSLPVMSNSGKEYIKNYVTESYASSIEPLDDINKEVYKRIYHNLPYLSKTKGTIPGLRALINCFGVPDTILRISEFGGRDKDTSTYDYFDQQFNYAAEASASSIIITPWILNTAWSASINTFKASSVQFRFKTSDFDTGSNYQIWSLNVGSNTPPSSSLVLRYSGPGLTTGSYSGSPVDPYYQHAYLTFYPKVNDIVNTASIYLPFFDHGWWSIMINKFQDTYTLYASNKLYYDGYDGNQIGYLASSSVVLANTSWTGSSSVSTFLSSSSNIGGTTYNRFTGSLQEIRYWIKTGSVDSFKDYVMNPQSIDYSGEVLYDDYLVFRLPLGGDLYTGSQSVHPRITGSWGLTGSFISSNNATLTNVSFTPNIETRFLNSPIVGLRGRVTDKIQIVSSSLPTGSVLSQYTSIEQSYPSLGSESPDVNMLEVAFSPQNEINDDIIDSLGYFNIGEYIGDPRQVSSSATSYPDLNALSNNFFQKYFDTYNLFDYVRLIKYFDNSLFKMIKDFVPARTSLTTGVVIKQHLLERNKYPQPQVDTLQFQNMNISSSGGALSSSFNYGEDLTYTGSIDTAFIDGGTGGTFDNYNVLEPYQSLPLNVLGSFYIDIESPINYFAVSSSACTIYTNTPINDNFSWNPTTGEVTIYFYGSIILGSGGNITPTDPINFYFSSSQNGVVDSFTTSALSYGYTTPVISCSYGEKFSLWVEDGGGGLNSCNISFNINQIYPYSNQTWFQHYTGSAGVSTIIHSTQDEFYNGELPGSEYVVTNGELNDTNEFKYPTTLEINYTPTLYLSNITSRENFLNINTSPNQGEIYLWFDTGSINYGPGLPGGGGNIG